MGDGSKEKLTINKEKYLKPPKGNFYLTYSTVEYGDNMTFTEDMILKKIGNMSDDSIEEDNYPMGAKDDPNAPYNQEDPKRGRVSETNFFNLLYSDDREFAILKGNDGKVYVFFIDAVDEEEFAEYADREVIPHGKDEDGMPDFEYGEWELNGEMVENYVNDNFGPEDAGKGLEDWEDGAILSVIDEPLKKDLMGTAKYIKSDMGRKHFIQALKQVPVGETTTAASSGSFVSTMGSGAMPIQKGISPEKAMKGVNEDGSDKSIGMQLKYNNIMHPTMGNFVISDIQKKKESDDKIKYIISLLDDNGELASSSLLYIFNKETGEEELFFNHDFNKLYDAYKVFDDVYNLVFDSLKEILRPKEDVQEQGIGGGAANSAGGGAQYDTPGFPASEFMGTKGKKGKAPVNKGTTHKNTMYPKGKFVKESTDNQTKTAYPDGGFVKLDDCTKLNNNKEAQKGGCSVGAVDNVVKTKKTKGSVVSDDALYYEVAKKTGRSIDEVKKLIQTKKA
jgi:hypothetical protein